MKWFSRRRKKMSEAEENKKVEELGKHVAYDPWDRVDPDHTAIRLATSWASQPEQLEELKRWI